MSATAVKLCKNELHEMTPENIRVDNLGFRRCVECERATYRRRYLREREKRNEASREWHRKNRDRVRDIRLQREFGITAADYEQMLVDQGGKCAICGSTDPAGKHGKRFAVDHCHETNKVRGLLCGRCNVMLGNAKDDPGTLRAAADYLERAE